MGKTSLPKSTCFAVPYSSLWGVLRGGGVLPSRTSSHLQGREVQGEPDSLCCHALASSYAA